jgi:hypothetical protein
LFNILPSGISKGFQATVVKIGDKSSYLRFDASGTSTLNSRDSSITLISNYTGATIYNRGNNNWVIMGDLH